MSVQPKPHLTPQEYLALERQAETKSEYYAGQVFAMAGASRKHVRIMVNIVASLNGQLKERPCEVFASDLRVRVSETGLYTYPDVVVTCEEPRFDDKHEDTLLNPTVIIEVLSRSTEAYDRGWKFAHYRTLESLTDYLLIAQDAPRIERYVRQPGHQWLFSDSSGLDAVAAIESIRCSLALADVYDKVDLETDPEAPRLVVIKDESSEFVLFG